MLKSDSRIKFTLIAFICSEITFFMTWNYIEDTTGVIVWLDITTFATLIGILIAIFYNRLPHMSIITLFYSIGIGLTLVALLCAY